MARIGYLDGWRGLAIIGVLIGHFLNVPGINPGRYGVELFFVLSGRLMAEILFIKKVELPNFFSRRFSRVYPTFAIFAVFTYISGIFPISWNELLSCLTFTYNYLHVFFRESIALNHIWSLCIEEHMYIILGLIAFFCNSRNLNPLPFLVCLTLVMMANGALRYADGYSYYQVYWRTDVRGASILVGAIAFLAIHRFERLQHVQSWLPILLGVLSVALNLGRIPDPIKYSAGTICLALSLVTLPSASGFFRRILENAILRGFGLISFSLYLWQQLFFAYGREHFGWLFAPLGLSLAMAVGTLSYFLVEKTSRRLTLRLLTWQWRKAS